MEKLFQKSSFILCLLSALLCQAQNTSYQKGFDPLLNSNYLIDGILVNETGKSFALLHGPMCVYCPIFLLMPSTGADTVHCRRVDISPLTFSGTPKTLYSADKILLEYPLSGGSFIFGLELSTNKAWMKRFQDGIGKTIKLKSFCQNENGSLMAVAVVDEFTTSAGIDDLIYLISIDSVGNLLNHREFKFSIPNQSEIRLYKLDIERNVSDGSFFFTGEVLFGPTWTENGYQIIIKFAKDGSLVNWKTVSGYEFERIFVREGYVYVLGRTNLPQPFTDNKSNAVIAKLDLNLNPVWAHCFYGEHFEYNQTTLNFLPDGKIVFGYSTFGPFPTILAKIDPSGTIISEKGYPLYQPKLGVMPDGSLLMATYKHFDQSGNVLLKTIIAKTDVDGQIDGCDDYPACLFVHPITIDFKPFDIQEIQDSIMAIDRPFIMDSLTFIFSDFCDIPAPPAPDFPLPDTICLGDTTRTAATRNILADQRTWNITGPGLSVTINDSLNVGFRPTQPGQFKVGQKVWFLGCGYEYERILTVLPPLSAQILPDSILCDGPPGLLSASANRPLTVYLWDNGEASPTISVFEEKTYSMTATDGFCSANDSAKIIFVSKIVGAEKPILLPNDTSVCAQTLPFLLKPASSFGNQFSLVGQNLPLDSTFLLKNSGVVTVQTTIAGCIFSEKFTLSVVECLPKIYFPTAFSPNGDGLNDSFGPQGAGFEAVKLSIFDRWGNLWYEGRGASPGWAPERCHEGVFTYLFEFKNLYTNSMELIAGSVTVAN